MEEAKRIRSIHKEKLEHVPELLHRIQSLLWPKEDARTCVLSKSWLHAWSTIPNLRFRQSRVASEEQRRDHIKLVERTLLRYIRDDIPFVKINLPIDIENHELASFAKKLIRLIATKSCFNELCLSMCYGIIGSFTIPDEIFSSNKLYKMSISGRQMKGSKPEEKCLLINRNPVINCVALRVLELWHVTISADVFEKLLSTCILLEKVDLLDCKGLKNIKVRNLRYLCELRIDSDTPDHILDIYNVPNIRSLNYRSRFQRNPLTLNIDSLRCVTKLNYAEQLFFFLFVNNSQVINKTNPFFQ
ncbi:F-box protein-like protein [Tanacetum coccineum]